MEIEKSKKYSWCCGYQTSEQNEGYICGNCGKICDDVREYGETRETRKIDLILEELKQIKNII